MKGWRVGRKESTALLTYWKFITFSLHLSLTHTRTNTRSERVAVSGSFRNYHHHLHQQQYNIKWWARRGKTIVSSDLPWWRQEAIAEEWNGMCATVTAHERRVFTDHGGLSLHSVCPCPTVVRLHTLSPATQAHVTSLWMWRERAPAETGCLCQN